VGPAANLGQPFLGSLSSFNGLDWQQTLAVLNGSAGGTWLDLSGVKTANGQPITGVNYIKFSVPVKPPIDPNTGNPELMMVDAVVGISGNSPRSISVTGTPFAAGTEGSDVPSLGFLAPALAGGGGGSSTVYTPVRTGGTGSFSDGQGGPATTQSLGVPATHDTGLLDVGGAAETSTSANAVDVVFATEF
jgi:hypothetical protein